MKCYEAVFETEGGNPVTRLVGGNTLAQAARKASEHEDDKTELVKLELTDKVII